MTRDPVFEVCQWLAVGLAAASVILAGALLLHAAGYRLFPDLGVLAIATLGLIVLSLIVYAIGAPRVPRRR